MASRGGPSESGSVRDRFSRPTCFDSLRFYSPSVGGEVHDLARGCAGFRLGDDLWRAVRIHADQFTSTAVLKARRASADSIIV